MKSSVFRDHAQAFCLAFGFVLLASAGVVARELQPAPEPREEQLDRHGHYENRTGEIVHQPAKSLVGQPPLGATAQCRDASFGGLAD
jgi:Protein of unknown function (DUF3761)